MRGSACSLLCSCSASLASLSQRSHFQRRLRFPHPHHPQVQWRLLLLAAPFPVGGLHPHLAPTDREACFSRPPLVLGGHPLLALSTRSPLPDRLQQIAHRLLGLRWLVSQPPILRRSHQHLSTQPTSRSQKLPDIA